MSEPRVGISGRLSARVSARARRAGGCAHAAAPRIARGAVALLLALLFAQPSAALALAFDSARPAPDAGAASNTAATRSLTSASTLAPAIIDYPGGFKSSIPARLRAGGVGIAIRYVAAKKWKSLTRSEANALRNGGVDIAVVYETKATWMLGGWSAGVSAAKKARASVVACGGPRTPFVWFACDTATTRYSKVNACLAGAASVLGADHVGIYGSYDVCAAALKSGYATKAWQTEAWSRGKVLASAAIYQRAHRIDGSLGLDYDSNLARTDDVGQWGYAPASLNWSGVSVPTTATLRALDFSADGTSGWMVGDAGTLLHTGDAGATWTTRTPPAQAGTPQLNGVRFTSGGAEGWAVGGAGVVLHTADGGATWESQPTPTTAELRGVDFTGPGNGWAVGDAGTLLHTTDGGRTWLAQPSSPTTASLLAVRFTSPSSGWAVGESGTILHTTNGGLTWTVQTASTPATLTAISLSADGATGWIVGTEGTLLRSLDGGGSWSRQPSCTAASLQSVSLAETVGGAFGSGGTILRSLNGGTAWASSSSPSTSTLLAASFPDARTGWAVGEGGTVLRAAAVGLSPFGTVSGAVTDALTGAPVGGVSVSVGPRLAAPTSPDGSFIAARTIPGTYTVAFTNPRYISGYVSGVGVTAAGRSVVRIKLVPKTATGLSAPSLDPVSAPVRTVPTTMSVTLAPSGAVSAAVTILNGWHYESKTVVKKVKGKKRKVKVWSWRLRFCAQMSPAAGGALIVRRALPAGNWRIQAKFPGSSTFLPSASSVRSFMVR